MLASCHIANTSQMTCHPHMCWHVGKILGLTARHREKNVISTCQTTCRQDAIQDFADMSAKSFGHKKKRQSFAENCAVMVWLRAWKSRKWYWMRYYMYMYHFFLKKQLLPPLEQWPHKSWIWLGSHAVTRQPTHDPVMNPVMASVTFGIRQFLADNVGVVRTRSNMLLTFPTKISLTLVPSFLSPDSIKRCSSQSFNANNKINPGYLFLPCKPERYSHKIF